jgi:hypothetical protein
MCCDLNGNTSTKYEIGSYNYNCNHMVNCSTNGTSLWGKFTFSSHYLPLSSPHWLGIYIHVYFPDESRSQGTETKNEQAHIIPPVLQEITVYYVCMSWVKSDQGILFVVHCDIRRETLPYPCLLLNWRNPIIIIRQRSFYNGSTYSESGSRNSQQMVYGKLALEALSNVKWFSGRCLASRVPDRKRVFFCKVLCNTLILQRNVDISMYVYVRR